MAKYEVSNEYTTKTFDDLDEVIDYITCNVSDETIIDLLDDIYGPVCIGSFTYSAGTILYKLERNRFNKYKDEYVYDLLMDMKYDIEENDEKEVDYLGFNIQVIED